MSSFVSKNLLWLAIFQSLAGYLLAYVQGWDLELAVLISTVMTLATALVAERFLPYRNDWNKNQQDFKTDISSALVLLAVVDPLLKLLGPIAVITVYGLFGSKQPALLNTLPLAIQIVLVTLLIEFGRYCSHRLHHSVKAFWWLHAMHHGSQRLYAINNMRFNPLNYALNFFIGAFPAMLLAPSPEALFGYLALAQPVLMLQHANIDLKSGWLNYIFSTNELHRWHHSADSSKANSNYGNAIVLWDLVFGTFRIGSVEDRTVQSVGLFESGNGYPSKAGYWVQLASFVRVAKAK